MRYGILSLFLCLVPAASAPASLGETNEDSTGICFRRVSALTDKGVVTNRYESVIVRQSSSLAKDIERLREVAFKGGPISNPDITANIWIGASISDTKFDSTVSEGCSQLPALKADKYL